MNPVGLYYFARREVHRFLKVINEPIFTPIVSSLIFLTIFYFVIGRDSKEYLAFLVPGLVMMSVVTNAFSNSAFSLFISRWSSHFEHILVMPLSYVEIALGYILGGMARGLVSGVAVLLATSLFVAPSMHRPLFALGFYAASTFLFASLGILVGLWAEQFDQIGMFNTFLLTPLTMLGGVFYSIKTLPSAFSSVVMFNPVFYMVDGFRYSMMGTSDISPLISLAVTAGSAALVFLVAVFLLRKGYKFRK